MSKIQRLVATTVMGIGGGIALLYAVSRYSAVALPISREAADDAAARPVVVVDRTEWDFGKCRGGQTLQAQFEIHNAGSRRLILRKLNGSCDCLSTREVEIVVDPGKSRIITADFDSGSAVGLLRIELDYRTNDPLQPRLKLYCSADVR